MGSSCGVVKSNISSVQGVALPIKKAEYHNLPGQGEMKKAGIGPYFQEQALNGGPKRFSRIAKWTAMVSQYALEDFPLEALYRDSASTEMVKRRVEKGPPQYFRWQAWMALRSLGYRISESAYEELPLSDQELANTILKDVPRTFPEEAYFQTPEGEGALYHILSKFAKKHESVSYCQGMNYIVGFMLLVSGGREVEVFYMLEDLMESFRGLFAPGLPYLRQCLYVLTEVVQKRLPMVHQALQLAEIHENCWATKWLMTLYTAVTPLSLTVRIWDLLMSEGVICLFKIGVVLLRSIETELIGHDSEAISRAFDDMNTRDFKVEELMRRVQKSQFKAQQLKTLERRYQKQSPDSLVIPERKSLDSISSKGLSSSTSVSTHFFDTGVSQSSVSTPVMKSSKVPNLPAIAKVLYQPEDLEQDEELRSDDEPVNARDVLEDLLRDQNICDMSLESISNLPPPKTQEVDKILSFVERLPY